MLNRNETQCIISMFDSKKRREDGRMDVMNIKVVPRSLALLKNMNENGFYKSSGYTIALNPSLLEQGSSAPKLR